MKEVKIGVCKEGVMFRAYCGTEKGSIAVVKSTSRYEALAQLFGILVTDCAELFYDDEKELL